MNIWKCRCGNERKVDVAKSGYNILLSHIKAKHPDYMQIYQEFVSSSSSASRNRISTAVGTSLQTKIDQFMDIKSRGIFKWLDWVIMDELELSFCESDRVREFTTLSKISSKTLKKYMMSLSSAVEDKIATMASASPCYALIFDGWTEDSYHFIGIYITLPKDNGFDIHLLAMAPFLDQTSFTASNHKNFILATLERYRLQFSKLVCLIGDNCSTNKATADLLGVPLLGCRSHRFNLAMEAYIETFLSAELDTVGKLMSKLTTLKEAGRLRQTTSLRPVRRNTTRWLGAVKMFELYERLRQFIDDSNPDVAVLLPTAAQRIVIRHHAGALNDFLSVTMSLQTEDVTIKESELLFRSLIE